MGAKNLEKSDRANWSMASGNTEDEFGATYSVRKLRKHSKEERGEGRKKDKKKKHRMMEFIKDT